MINKEICAAYGELLFEYAEYIDGSAAVENGADDKYKEIEAHLQECEACRAELDECRRMLSAVRASAVTAPSELHGAVMWKVTTDAKQKRRRRFVRRVAGVAAVFVLAVGIYAAVASGVLDRAIGDAFDMMAPGKAADGAGAFDENNGAWGGGINADMDAEAEDKADENANAAPDIDNSGGAEEDRPNGGDAEGDLPETDFAPEDAVPDTPGGDELISKGEIPEKAQVYFENATAGSDYDGGISVMLTGDDAAEAIALLADMFEMTLYENVMVLDAQYYENLTAVIFDFESEFKSFDAVGYRIDGNGDNECIVIFAP